VHYFVPADRRNVLPHSVPSLSRTFSSPPLSLSLSLVFYIAVPAVLFIVGYTISHPYRERQIARRVTSSSYCALTWVIRLSAR